MYNIPLTTKADRWLVHHPTPHVTWTKEPLKEKGFDVHYPSAEDDPFLVLKFLGASAQGVVNWCRSRETGAEIVIKKFFSASSSFEKSREALENEVNILRKLKHFHTVRYEGSYQCEQEFGVLEMPKAMCNLDDILCGFEHCPSKKTTFEAAFRLHGWDTSRFLLSTMGCIARTLHYLHQDIHVRHKDIKPQNILFLDSPVPQVLLCDFGISRIFTDNQTGTSGATTYTATYAPPEAFQEGYRGRRQDIYSLGLVYAEIFIAFKGESISQLRAKLHKGPRSFEYQNYTHELLTFVSDLCTDRCDTQFLELLTRMLSTAQEHRPHIDEVWHLLSTFATSEAEERTYFCGACCMPLVSIVAREGRQDAPPRALEYFCDPTSAEQFGTSYDITARFEIGGRPNFEWRRNLQISNMSFMDEVRDTDRQDMLLSRKRIYPSGNNVESAQSYPSANDIAQAREAAQAEHDVLKQVDHHHIVKLSGAYSQGHCSVLLVEPAASYNLESYLRLVTIKHPKKQDIHLADTTTILRQAFGCLAHAVNYLHEKNFMHGDIRASQILIEKDQVYLGPFGHLGSRIREDNIQGTNYDPQEDEDSYLRQNKHVRRESKDIYSLGLVFIEIQTVRCGRSLEEMHDYCRLDETKLASWVTKIGQNDCNPEHGEKFLECLKSMVATKESERPTAARVLEVMQACVTKNGGRFRCGSQT